MNVPLVLSDATALTQAGYVGEDVYNIMSKLLQATRTKSVKNPRRRGWTWTPPTRTPRTSGFPS